MNHYTIFLITSKICTFKVSFHFKKEKQLETIINTSFKDKAARNSSDYIERLLHVCNWLIENHPSHYVISLLKTMCEMQEILYLVDVFRNAHTILRFYNVTVQHSILIKKHIQGRLKMMIKQEFFGAYYQSLLSCTWPVAHLFGESQKYWKGKRNFLETMANLTSNKNPNHVLYNSVVRLQMQNEDESLKRKTKIKPLKHLQTNQDFN